MSVQAEIEPQEEAWHIPPTATFGTLLQEAQAEGFPARLGWAGPVGADGVGYVVKAAGTRRVVAIIEGGVGQETSQWCAQTFRVRRQSDNAAVPEDLCQQMMLETTHSPVEQEQVTDALQQLYVGKGMELQYPEVVLECNNPQYADGIGGDGYVSSTSPRGEAFSEVDFEEIDLADVCRQAFVVNDSEEATLATDVGTHMGDLSAEYRLDDDIDCIVYRSRFHNYPWAFGTDGPLIDDLLLIKVNDGSIWYIGKIEFGREITPDNVDSFMSYGNQLISMEVAAVFVDGLMSRIRRAKTRGLPSFLLADLLERSLADDLETD